MAMGPKVELYNMVRSHIRLGRPARRRQSAGGRLMAARRMDWITNRAAHKGFLGVTVGEEIYTDLDYADDVSLLASMLESLL